MALVSWSCTGLGMLLSTTLPPQKSLLVGVMAPLVLAFLGCHTDAQRDGLLQVRTIPRDISAAHTMPLLSVCMDRWITCISFNRWVTEYLVVKELSIAAHRSRSVTLPHRADSFHGTHTCHGTPVISGHGHFNGT